MAYQKKYFLGRYVCRTTIPCPNCSLGSSKTREPHRERVPAHIKALDNMAWEFSGEIVSFFATGLEVNGAGSSSTVVGASATISCLRTNIFALLARLRLTCMAISNGPVLAKALSALHQQQLRLRSMVPRHLFVESRIALSSLCTRVGLLLKAPTSYE
ncbi:uncharacterized protein CCOS01_03155 [Colletotrichum costaricense]|uniref:Uncharacterized protein n=1 Tax=Colletotrichum costaricense TaxID=1209916 RepID=A0AAI9Z4T4_9PEZI|nr:uncharacterized protein CCOS01_03155 [Colletotrichum costaricense]KAK1534403.1 hypothetical protein CCOS01_03155 [Colletotrichum costaricense]